MRAIDYFDRGHDRDPQRLAIVDTDTGLKLTFAQTKALSERIAAAMQKNGFENQDLLGPALRACDRRQRRDSEINDHFPAVLQRFDAKATLNKE